MINRILEKRVISDLKHSPAVAILGPRQVGKQQLQNQLLLNLKLIQFTLILRSHPIY